MFRFACLISIFLLASCRQHDSQETPTDAQPQQTQALSIGQDSPEGFIDFYQKFHSDSLFQIERITWPLTGKGSRGEEDATPIPKWSKEDWRHHRRLDTESGFDQSFEVLSEDLVLEQIVAREGHYQIIRRFARLSGGWHLIYYAESLN